MTCPYCRTGERPNGFRPTCGADACRLAHQRARVARNARRRYGILTAANQCGKCGRPRTTRTSKTTGQPIVSRCAFCLRVHTDAQNAANEARRAEKARLEAVARLAAAQIERDRIQRARLAAGLPLSLAVRPVVPKNTPIPVTDL